MASFNRGDCVRISNGPLKGMKGTWDSTPSSITEISEGHQGSAPIVFYWIVFSGRRREFIQAEFVEPC